MPQQLIKEVLQAVAEMAAVIGNVVVDLCAGFQSTREEVIKAGARYVAVDIEGPSAVRNEVKRKAATVLTAGGKVLAVERKTEQGECLWAIPSGRQEASDNSLHAAGARSLTEETGILESEWTQMVGSGPKVKASRLTTYYTYSPNQPFVQALTTRRFAERRTTSEITRIAWVGKADVAAMRWRSEDAQFINELFRVIGDRSGGC